MKPTARVLAEGNPVSAFGSDPSQEIEQSLAAAEDARSEAAAMALERDATAEALRRTEAALTRRDAELAVMRARLANLQTRLETKEQAGAETTEELRVAMEELQASSECLEEANLVLLRSNEQLERRVAERTAALAESEARLRATTDAVPHLVWTSDAHGWWTWANRRWVEYTGMRAEEASGFGWLEPVHPDDRDATMAAWREAEANGALRVEHRLRAANGAYRWFVTRALPERRSPGQANGKPAAPATWYGTATDVDDARRAETSLRESEARFRGFAENSSDVLWIVDNTGEKLEYLSPAFERIWGEPPDAVMEDLRRWGDLLHPEDRGAVLGTLSRALRGERVQVEYRIRRGADGAVRWIKDTGFPILDAAGRVHRIAGLAQDVTEQREASERQRLLLNELNHRVKNALAGAQAIAAHTARGAAADSPAAFVLAFEARLMALARAHDMLTREGWRGASLAEVVAETLAPHEGGGPDRVSVSGPEVRLMPGAAVALHMAFHELAMNAAKYGALSVPGGRVRVEWSTAPAASPGQPGSLDIAWRERGGPPVPGPPARPGFGGRLLERGLPQQLGGEARLRFEPGGVEFDLRLPLSKRVKAA